MEPNKLDREFRDKLDNRTLNPSPAAWDRLDAMLTIAEEKKPAKKYSWLFIAAAIVSFLMISGIFLFQKNEIEAPAEIVLEEKAPVNESSKPVQLNGAMSTQVAVAEEPKENLTPSKYIKRSNIKNSDRAVNPHSFEKMVQIENVTVSIENKEELIAEALVSTASTDANKTPVKVDASQLLSEVDNELELSFREKVIKSAGKNFQNVKVALANRNFE